MIDTNVVANLDLTQRSDCRLVQRAVYECWELSPDVREALAVKIRDAIAWARSPEAPANTATERLRKRLNDLARMLCPTP